MDPRLMDEDREVALVTAWLGELARETVAEAEPPDPGRILWRAEVERRLEERRALVERAARPIRLWERVAAAALAAGAVTTGWLGLGAGGVALERLADPSTVAALGLAAAAAAGWTARRAVHDIRGA